MKKRIPISQPRTDAPISPTARSDVDHASPTASEIRSYLDCIFRSPPHWRSRLWQGILRESLSSQDAFLESPTTKAPIGPSPDFVHLFQRDPYCPRLREKHRSPIHLEFATNVEANIQDFDPTYTTSAHLIWSSLRSVCIFSKKLFRGQNEKLAIWGNHLVDHNPLIIKAEGVGFEPTVACATLDFESSALNRTQPSLLNERIISPFRQLSRDRPGYE